MAPVAGVLRGQPEQTPETGQRKKRGALPGGGNQRAGHEGEAG